MDDKERLKLKQHYEQLQDEQIIAFLKEGESAFEFEAYVLIKEEARRRNLENPYFAKSSVNAVGNKRPENASLDGSPITIEDKIAPFLAIAALISELVWAFFFWNPHPHFYINVWLIVVVGLINYLFILSLFKVFGFLIRKLILKKAC